MTEYGQAFYGSDEISRLINGHSGDYKSDIGNWISRKRVTFGFNQTLYRLPIGHSFYGSDEFKRAKKPYAANPLADCSYDELRDEIERRQSQDDEITVLARKLCAERNDLCRSNWINGDFDDISKFKIAKAAIIAGMELQKGREA